MTRSRRSRRRRSRANADRGARRQPELPSASELMQRTLEAMRLEAQIAKDMEAYQKRPKRRFVGARAEEYRFARYVEDWRAQGRAHRQPQLPRGGAAS